VPCNEQLLAQSQNLAAAKLTRTMSPGQPSEEILRNRITTIEAYETFFEDLRDDLVDALIGTLHQREVSASQPGDDVIAPGSEIVSAVYRHSEEFGNDLSRIRKREEMYEVPFPIGIESLRPHPAPEGFDSGCEFVHRPRAKGVLENPTLAPMVGVVRGSQDAPFLHEHARACSV